MIQPIRNKMNSLQRSTVIDLFYNILAALSAKHAGFFFFFLRDKHAGFFAPGCGPSPNNMHGPSAAARHIASSIKRLLQSPTLASSFFPPPPSGRRAARRSLRPSSLHCCRHRRRRYPWPSSAVVGNGQPLLSHPAPGFPFTRRGLPRSLL